MTQKHIFLIVLAGLWGFLHKAMTSLQSVHGTQPIRTQKRESDPLRHGSAPMSRWVQMPPPCISASHVLCGCTLANIKTQTHICTPTQKSNTHRQLYLFSLTPAKCTEDQTKERWTAHDFSYFLDNLITSVTVVMQQGQPWSKVTLCWVHSRASVFRGGEGKQQSHRQLDAISSQIQKHIIHL